MWLPFLESRAKVLVSWEFAVAIYVAAVCFYLLSADLLIKVVFLISDSHLAHVRLER